MTKFEEFEDYRRGETQSNVEYINVFDARHRKIEKRGMKSPPAIMTFKLLRRVNIDNDHIAGMNYDVRASTTFGGQPKADPK